MLLFQEDNSEIDIQSFEYADEIRKTDGMWNEQMEEKVNCSELRSEMFKVADRAIGLLLKFLKLFLPAIGKMMQSEVLLNFANIIPQTLYSIVKNLCLHKDNFIKYAVCPKCITLYKFDDCIQWRPNGEEVSKKCRHVNYPHHPHKRRRKQCGTILMKTMRSKSGRTFLYPKQLYCFKKVTSSLEDLINKPNFKILKKTTTLLNLQNMFRQKLLSSSVDRFTKRFL